MIAVDAPTVAFTTAIVAFVASFVVVVFAVAFAAPAAVAVDGDDDNCHRPRPQRTHVSNNLPMLPAYTAVISPPFATVLEGVGGLGGD